MHPRGAVGVVIQSPSDYWHSYRVCFPDAFEAALHRQELVVSFTVPKRRRHRFSFRASARCWPSTIFSDT